MQQYFWWLYSWRKDRKGMVSMGPVVLPLQLELLLVLEKYKNENYFFLVFFTFFHLVGLPDINS